MHFGAANFLFCQEPGVQTTLGKKKKKAGAAREALGSLTELKNYARGLGNCDNVGSSLGALALLKRHFGLAIEVGRQGQEQARPRRKSLMDRVAFLHPAPVHPVLVTRRKATLLLICFKRNSQKPTEWARS